MIRACIRYDVESTVYRFGCVHGAVWQRADHVPCGINLRMRLAPTQYEYKLLITRVVGID